MTSFIYNRHTVTNKIINPVPETLMQNQGPVGDDVINNNKNVFENQRSIRNFYNDAVIFITGGTGFLGKALIEKLLRTCEGIRGIYILLRAKRGLTSEQRYKEFIKHHVFDRLRLEKPNSLDKLLCVTGDVSQPCLGLNEADSDFLINHVTVVFHSAATVKFNEGLKEAANLNALGTQRLMDLCAKMVNLKSVVHISTAYCNPGRKYIGETVYPPILPMNKEAFLRCVDFLPPEILEPVADQMRGPHPNTYTLTKSIAEQIVMEYSKRFPVSIIRPSIVTGAIEDPYPGWVDNVQGITGIMMEIGRGTISSILGDESLTCDIIPVDVVVNTIIGAAWLSGSGQKQFQVYNCTSGQINPISWKNLGLHTMKWARINPSKYLMMYPAFSYRKNEFMHKLYEIFFHFLPALVFDLIMRSQGSKPIMFKIAKKFKSACHTGKFFALHEWVFENENQKRLFNDIKTTEDGIMFSSDLSTLDYDDYIRNYMMGIRKYVLKDGEESLKRARRKVAILFWTRTLFQLGIMLAAFIFMKRLFL